MTLKQKNIQFIESTSPGLSCKSKYGTWVNTVDFSQPEDSSIKIEYNNNLTSLNLKTTSKIYTKKGDLGKCSLLSGERVLKDSDSVEASGDVDELNSALGLLVSLLPQKTSWLAIEIELIQETLFQIGALIATNPNSSLSNKLTPVLAEQVRSLEQSIDFMDGQLPTFKKFIKPGGYLSAAQANVARSVCRRAERHVIKHFKNEMLKELPESMKNIPSYMNRLSDYLFVLGRYCNFFGLVLT